MLFFEGFACGILFLTVMLMLAGMMPVSERSHPEPPTCDFDKYGLPLVGSGAPMPTTHGHQPVPTGNIPPPPPAAGRPDNGP